MKYIIGLTALLFVAWLLVSTWVNRDRPIIDGIQDRREQRRQRKDDRARPFVSPDHEPLPAPDQRRRRFKPFRFRGSNV